MKTLNLFFCVALVAGALSPALALPTNKSTAKKNKDFLPRCYPRPCAGTTRSDDVSVCGDPRLGPIRLPKSFPVTIELATYARFGNLCPGEFLEEWVDPASDWFRYPDDSGFALDTDGNPIMANATLPVGRKLDRFGSERGNFLGPLGAPYIERSLPPANLNHPPDSDRPYNYFVYEVKQPLEVLMGPVASWFEQPGMGTQFMTAKSVGELITEGYLQRLTPDEYDERVEYADKTQP